MHVFLLSVGEKNQVVAREGEREETRGLGLLKV